MGYKSFLEKSVGPEMAAVLPKDDIPWYRKPHLLRLNLSIMCLLMFSSANGYDGSLMNGIQALPQWHIFMNHPKGSWLGFVNAVQSLGAFVFYPFVAWCNNKIGRKKTVGIGYFWLVLGTAVQTCAKNDVTFVLGRLFIGGVSAFFSASAPVLITETAYPTHRGVLTALFNCGWYVGSLVAAWVTYGSRNYEDDWSWRIPSLVQAAIPVTFLLGYLTAPESPRWLVSVGRIDEARDFLVKYHGDGDEDSPLVDFEIAEITRVLDIETNLQKTSFSDMLRSKGNRLRTFISVTLGIFAQWSGNGVVSYYLVSILSSIGITSLTSQTMISGFLQFWNLIVAVSAAFSVDFMGRRKLFFISTIGMLASYTAITVLSAWYAQTYNTSAASAVIPILFIFYGFYDIAFTPLIVSYTCEIWPYSYRARGLGITLTSTQLAVFFNIFVNPVALESLQWRYYIVYIVLLMVMTVTIYFFYPETNGHSLEDVAKVFDDGDDRHSLARVGSQDEAERHSTTKSNMIVIDV